MDLEGYHDCLRGEILIEHDNLGGRICKCKNILDFE
jgi:hypothetical protein